MDNKSLILVVDLEATCWQDKIISPGRPQTVDEMEIIEFGCTLAQTDGIIIDSRSFMVRPVKHPILSTFCTELTTITQQDVDAAPPYLEAVKQIDEWLSPYSLFAWGSWGNYDRKQLDAESRHHGQTPIFGYSPHLNLKPFWRKGRANARRGGLQNALKFHDLPFVGTEHRGIDDALNIAKLLPFINFEASL
ncbi:3'-5' exonuclease [uncultured Methylophaga sp.]|uniref:3'-5' exonuclease n=1 Tax=uncultured Methylophaga sp. TaxID=285271 RepID=UPI002606D781|nr:3'-5' exonuclease [uncultured Methylophaga sp.]